MNRPTPSLPPTPRDLEIGVQAKERGSHLLESLSGAMQAIYAAKSRQARRFGTWRHTVRLESAGVATPDMVREELYPFTSKAEVRHELLSEILSEGHGKIPNDWSDISLCRLIAHPAFWGPPRRSTLDFKVRSGDSLTDVFVRVCETWAAELDENGICGEDCHRNPILAQRERAVVGAWIASTPQWFQYASAVVNANLNPSQYREESNINYLRIAIGHEGHLETGSPWRHNQRRLDISGRGVRILTQADPRDRYRYEGPDIWVSDLLAHREWHPGLYPTPKPEFADLTIRSGQRVFAAIRRWYKSHAPDRLPHIDSAASRFGEVAATARQNRTYRVHLDWTPAAFLTLGDLDDVDGCAGSCFCAGGQHEIACYVLGLHPDSFVAIIRDENDAAVARAWGVFSAENTTPAVFVSNIYIASGYPLNHPAIYHLVGEAVKDLTGWAFDGKTMRDEEIGGEWSVGMYFNGGGVIYQNDRAGMNRYWESFPDPGSMRYDLERFLDKREVYPWFEDDYHYDEEY